MFKPVHLFTLITALFTCTGQAQQLSPKSLSHQIDSLIGLKTIRPFNGLIVITQNDKVVYEKCAGYADFDQKTPLTFESQFVAGSISKQITAVLILRELDKGHLDLHTPVRKYLPRLKQSWADTVTIYHLLNHTSGITGYDKPLAFVPGTRFSYSGDGYGMLGNIIEAVSGKSYAEMTAELFRKCGMSNSTHPDLSKRKNLVMGYTRREDGSIEPDSTTFDGSPVPAGRLISSPKDLIKWNKALHGGKLLKAATYRQMTTPSVTRDHPIFGHVGYGFSIQIDTTDQITDYGHGGSAPGFVAVNFYYPESGTNLVIMENLDWHDEHFIQNFLFETNIRKLVRQALK